jgi:hypothetical protein
VAVRSSLLEASYLYVAGLWKTTRVLQRSRCCVCLLRRTVTRGFIEETETGAACDRAAHEHVSTIVHPGDCGFKSGLYSCDHHLPGSLSSHRPPSSVQPQPLQNTALVTSLALDRHCIVATCATRPPLQLNLQQQGQFKSDRCPLQSASFYVSADLTHVAKPFLMMKEYAVFLSLATTCPLCAAPCVCLVPSSAACLPLLFGTATVVFTVLDAQTSAGNRLRLPMDPMPPAGIPGIRHTNTALPPPAYRPLSHVPEGSLHGCPAVWCVERSAGLHCCQQSPNTD